MQTLSLSTQAGGTRKEINKNGLFFFQNTNHSGLILASQHFGHRHINVKNIKLLSLNMCLEGLSTHNNSDAVNANADDNS